MSKYVFFVFIYNPGCDSSRFSFTETIAYDTTQSLSYAKKTMLYDKSYCK